MIMRNFLLVLLTLLFVSCTKDCKQKEELNNYFISALNAIEGSESDLTISQSNAFLFLDILTGIEPSVKGGHWGLYYETEEDKIKDLASWKYWYDQKACTIDIDQLNLSYNSLVVEYESSNVKFPKDWRKLFEEEGWGF